MVIRRRDLLGLGSAIAAHAITGRFAQATEENRQPASKPPLGSMLFCGGGKLPDSILDRFCELGNIQRGSLVLIPTASPRSDNGDYSPWLQLWESKGWKEIHIVHAGDRAQATKEGFVTALDKVTAVWIAGGDQSRLSERFLDTPVLGKLKEVLQRGGVLGGTSAGAAILSQRMISGGTVNPEFGEGFGLLPKVIIDQHFSQKKREERLAKGVAMYPDLLGLGIDESTGIEWNAKQAKVLGLGQVHHYAIESTNNKPHWEQVQRESFPEGTLFQPNKYPRLFEQ